MAEADSGDLRFTYGSGVGAEGLEPPTSAL